MNSQAHALVVITNKTNMRDFSQGIFRLRSLLEIVNLLNLFDIFENKNIFSIHFSNNSWFY